MFEDIIHTEKDERMVFLYSEKLIQELTDILISQMKMEKALFSVQPIPNGMFKDIIEGEKRRCESCWWGTGRPAEDDLNKVYCSLEKKEKPKAAFCGSWRAKFNV